MEHQSSGVRARERERALAACCYVLDSEFPSAERRALLFECWMDVVCCVVCVAVVVAITRALHLSAPLYLFNLLDNIHFDINLFV